jgi:hypothetical protein
VNSLARVPVNQDDKYWTINKWLGVNESGDINLRMGEASTMTNLKITPDYNLQKRPGSQNIANLLFDYSILTAAETTDVLTEVITTTAEFIVKPTIDVTDGGLLTLTGATATMNYANHATHTNKYYQDINGVIWKFSDSEFNDGIVGGIQQYRWSKWNAQLNWYPGTYSMAASVQTGGASTGSGSASGYTSYNFDTYSGQYSPAGSYVTVSPTAAGTVYTSFGSSLAAYSVNGSIWSTWSKGVVSNGNGYYYYTKGSTNYGYVYGASGAYPNGGLQTDGGTQYYYDSRVAKTSYTWKFNKMSVVPNVGPAPLRGIWSGRVGTNEVICAACDGRLWQLSELNGVWTKASVGSLNTDNPVHFFGFDTKLYMLNGTEYKVWNGTTLSTVTGYRPLIATATPPTGGGTALERINMLNGQRRVRFSPNGSATVFTLPEQNLASVDYAKVVATDAPLTISSSNLTAGTTTLSAAPTTGTNTVEIGYTVSATYRSQIEAMTLSELYNGANDNRIFIYGDGSNKAFYSGLDGNGQPTAEYFPDLNVVHVGEANTPITSMLRHYDRLLAFKSDSAYSIRYDAVQLVSGTVTAGFYTLPIHKGLGCVGYGQAIVVGNHPRTLDGRSIYEWTATTSSGNITSDQRNAQSVSQNVETTIRSMTLENAFTFMDKINHEFYVVENGVAIIQNTENGAWYTYRNFPAVCMIVYKDEVYFGTADGYIRHVSRDYLHDLGDEITTYWESGSMDFGKSYMTKYTDEIYIVPKPEDGVFVNVTILTDKKQDYEDETIIPDATKIVGQGFFSFLNLNFTRFTFGINRQPQTHRKKIKAKGYAWMKLIFSSVTNDTTFTILSASIKVRETGKVK